MGYMTAATTGVILSSGNTVFNEASADKDFRIESDDNTHQLFVDAGNNRLGIGTSTPLTTVDIEDGLTTVGAVLTLSTKEPTVVDGDVIGRLNFRAPLETGADALLLLASIHAEADATFDATTNSTELVFSTAAGDAAAERVRIASDGNVGIGTTAPTAPLHISATGTDEVLRLESTDSDGAVAPVMSFKRTSSTPVDGDNIGIIQFLGMNSNQDDGAGTEAEHLYADMYARINDITATEEDGEIYFRTLSGGALKRRLDINALGVVFNEESLDMNFRVESNGNANMLVVDGGTDRVGIGVLAPTATLDVVGDVRFRASVEVCTSDPAPASIETGTVYQFTKGSAGVFTLPVNPPVGTQFVLVNGTANDIVITRPASGVKINGATANATNTTAYAATSIVAVVTGTNAEWLAFGGI
jgi:hypothetical protein